MTMCPQCQARPSRKPLRYRGTPPLCEWCAEAAEERRRAQTREWKRRNAYRTPRPGSRRVVTSSDMDRREWSQDIPAAEIERRYQQALIDIRRRRACESQTRS